MILGRLEQDGGSGSDFGSGEIPVSSCFKNSWGADFLYLAPSREGELPMSFWSLVSGSEFEWRSVSVRLVGFPSLSELVAMRI